MKSKRIQSWPTHLAIFQKEKRHLPFEWGKNDCCLFAADWLRLCIGVDLAAEYRGKYDSALSAARILCEFGGITGLVEDIGAEQEWEETPKLFLQRGDIALVDTPNGTAVAVVFGIHAAVAGTTGTALYPVTSILKGWRVG